nr:type III-B CRISPR module-associated protein Cmr3 [Conchiformibius kuhniae]
MRNYWIDALSPLVFRSGKPFGAQSDTHDIAFPLPSAAAGLVRTCVMRQNGWHDLSNEQSAQLNRIAAHGLFLARQRADGETVLLLPKPADALYLRHPDTQETLLVRLSPRAADADCGSDLPAGLLPVRMSAEHEHLNGKPQSGAKYWCAEDFAKWQNGAALSFDTVKQNGANDLPTETRTHTAVDAQSGAAKDAQLFQTTAYDFSPAAKKRQEGGGWQPHRYGFVIRTEQDLAEGLVCFGGEGRLSRLHALAQDAGAAFAAPSDAAGVRLTLLTPAIFKNGWLPGWLDEKTLCGTFPHTDVRVKLRAAALERWQPVSGWDLHRHQPKAMRKAVPAGSVYWLECETGGAAALADAVSKALSDHPQDRLDGFGIAALAAWTPPQAA